MTGPKHYREAETHLECAAHASTPQSESYHIGKAQVHAILALAAATAEPLAQAYVGSVTTSLRAWSEAIS